LPHNIGLVVPSIGGCKESSKYFRVLTMAAHADKTLGCLIANESISVKRSLPEDSLHKAIKERLHATLQKS